jgi:hypothetical protein
MSRSQTRRKGRCCGKMSEWYDLHDFGAGAARENLMLVRPESRNVLNPIVPGVRPAPARMPPRPGQT